MVPEEEVGSAPVHGVSWGNISFYILTDPHGLGGEVDVLYRSQSATRTNFKDDGWGGGVFNS
jgi:hypothetical protein